MGYFTNNKDITFRKIKENEDYRKALEKRNISLDALLNLLINQVNGDYNGLNNLLDKTVRDNFEIMSPIIYSVRYEQGTYEVYRYCGESVQENEDLAIQIIREEPDVFVGTEVSNNSNFILKIAKDEPRVVKVMSESLKSNTNFTAELCNLNDKEITKYAAQECKMPDTVLENPDLSGNKGFMAEAVKEDTNSLKYASEELKNDPEFIKETAKESKEVINYISGHTEEFGNEGLTAAKEVLVDYTTDRAIDEFKEELKKVQEQKQSKNEGQEVGDTKDSRKLAIRERQLNNNMRLIEKIKNGEVKPERAIRLINNICKNLGEQYREELMQYIKMDDAIIERQKETKDKEESETTSDGKAPDEIEGAISAASLKGAKQEISIIKEEKQKEEKPKEALKTSEEEKKYDKSNDERA